MNSSERNARQWFAPDLWGHKKCMEYVLLSSRVNKKRTCSHNILPIFSKNVHSLKSLDKGRIRVNRWRWEKLKKTFSNQTYIILVMILLR